MRPISLGGSPAFKASMAKWRAEQAPVDKAANRQEPCVPDSGWPIARVHRRGQLYDDWFMSDVLHATALRLFHDYHYANGPESEVQRERLAAFKAATLALGPHYTPVVAAVTLNWPEREHTGKWRSISEVGSEVLGFTNRSEASAVAMERLNAGLRRLSVHYGALAAA